MAFRIIDKLNLSEDNYKSIVEKFDGKVEIDLLSIQNFKILSHWEHFGVLNLLKLRDFQNDVTWMSKKLSLPIKKVENAIERLKRVGVLVENKNGNLGRVSRNNLDTTTDIRSQALQVYTQESFEMGVDALKNVDIDKRDFSTVTLSVNKNDLKRAKKLIEEFRYKFDKEIESVPGDEVYKLVIGFYPLTKFDDNIS